MNYYEHHLGDYMRDAGHLSMTEDGAYRRLIEAYYSREAPLPLDIAECQKLARCVTAADKKAVAYVLGKFFQRREDGYHQKRCDEEIAAYLEGEPERENKRENNKERKRRSRQRRAELFETLRGHGVTMHYRASISELEAELSRVTSHANERDASRGVTRDGHGTERLPSPQSPVPSPQDEDSRRDEASPVGTLKTQIYRLAKQLSIAAGVITTELQAHSETEVWSALGATLAAKPAEPLPYFRGCLKDAAASRFKSA
jgi:uncharacterized protein YdaU (DUF1376 family)